MDSLYDSVMDQAFELALLKIRINLLSEEMSDE